MRREPSCSRPRATPKPSQRALVRLAREAELRRAFGARNRERVRTHFGEARMLDEHVELILGELARGRTGA